MSVHVTSRVWKHSKSRNGNRLVLLAISDFVNHQDGWAWPSISALQEMTQLSESSVHAAITHLVSIGELEVGYKKGPHGCNMYRVTIPGDSRSEVREVLAQVQKAAEGTLEDLVTTLQNLANTYRESGPEPPEPSENQKTPPSPPRGESGVQPALDAVTDEPVLEAWFTADGDESVKPSRPDPGSDADPGFCAFWTAYPRHVAKGSARKAWRAALRKGVSSGEIIAGAEHYRDDRRRRSRPIEYTCHPATWLNAERWLENGHDENAARYVYNSNPYEN